MHSVQLAAGQLKGKPVSPLTLPPGGASTPQPCGNVTVFCPAGASFPSLATPGFYTAPVAGLVTNATDVMAREVECPRGFWCRGGVRTQCPAGTFGSAQQGANVSECQTCGPGGYCPAGSSEPVPCGSGAAYCPAGVAAPLVAGPWHYTVGIAGARLGQVTCGPGTFCPGDGHGYDCPAGACVCLSCVGQTRVACVKASLFDVIFCTVGP